MSSPKKVAKVAINDNSLKVSPNPAKGPQSDVSKSVRTPQKVTNNKSITPLNGPLVKELPEPARLIASKDHQKNDPASKDHSSSKSHIAKPQNLSEEIEQKIKSRKRVLETLEEQSKFANEEVLLQISSRDMLIEELNKEVVILKSKVKKQVKNKTKEEAAAEKSQKIAELESEKSALENKIIIIKDKHRNEIAKFEEGKTHFELLQETMSEEIEVLRAQLKSKDEEIESVIKDVKKLSEIIQQFKVLNNDLNMKIEKQNSEYENMSTKFYETEVKAASLVDLENNLQDYIGIYQQSESRANKISEELRNTQVLYDDIQAFCAFSEERIEEALAEIDDSSNASKILKNLKKELAKKKKIVVKESDESKKDAEIRELKENLAKALRDLKHLENSQSPLMQQVEGSKNLLQTLRNEHSNSIESFQKSVKALQDYTDSMKLEIASLRSESSKKDSKIAIFSQKLSTFESKLLNADEKIKKLSEEKKILEKETSEAKIKISQIKAQTQEKLGSIEALEKQNSKYVLNIQALHEEFWKKDTALIKAKKSNIQLQKSISELNAQILKLSSGKHSENTEKLMKEIYDKDQKIEILKEMVKASHVKSKENKKEGLSPDASLQEIHSEKAQKISNDLVNSLASKTINKFFTICSFHRNSPQDTPPDIQRLLKKLKQDLKSYSVFNVKELQNSVIPLQHVFFDNKAHVGLEELIAIISKSVSL